MAFDWANFAVMSFLDIILFLALAYGAWKGFRKGLIIELATLAAFILGIWAGINFSDWTANGINDATGWNSDYLPVVAFTVTFLAVGAGVYFGGKALEKVINLAALKPLNKVAGLMFGLGKVLFIASVSLVILESYDEKGEFIKPEWKEESTLYHPVKDLSLATIPDLKYSELFLPKKEAPKKELGDSLIVSL